MHVPLESITWILSFQMMKNLLGLFWPCSHLCVGMMRTPYITSFSYSVTFIDKATKKCWIYFMKHKSKVFEKYCELKSVKKKTGHGIQSKSWEVIMVEVKSWYWLLTMDYDDTFSPVAQYTTIRWALSFVSYFNWSLH